MKYLELTLRLNMCPVHIIFTNNSLAYSRLLVVTEASTSGDLFRSDLVIKTLKGQLEAPFSFLEYGSENSELGLWLATSFPNSSVVSLHRKKRSASSHYASLLLANITNNIIIKNDGGYALTHKLFESPEFLRYQLLNWHHQTALLVEDKMRPSDMGKFLGLLFGTGATTFAQVPADAMVSLLMATFFPAAAGVYKGNLSSFFSKDHPYIGFKGAGQALLQQASLPQNYGTKSVATTVLHPVLAGQPWRLVRINVINLSVTVNHHFEYEIDGHTRKYQLHCETNASGRPSVYIVRQMDGFSIPYQTIESVSLIALMRMGLLTQIKDRFYDEFLRLPMYEDMAPWNIVFRKGHLDYIDYDTKDRTYNHVVPMAYQIMAILMNYERTVKDFGHCKLGNGRNEYGFPFISHCVGTPGNKCRDSAIPVACPDHTCRETYVMCLQALSAIEQNRTRISDAGTLTTHLLHLLF